MLLTPRRPGLEELAAHRTSLTAEALREVQEALHAETTQRIDGVLRLLAQFGPSRAKSAPRSLRRALLMPQVITGSFYRCGKRT